MRVLQAHNAVPLLHQCARDGAVVGGFSAGSIMLARQWIRWADPQDDHSAEVFDCAGLAPVLCDTHAEDDDWEELKALLRLRRIEGEEGYGIATDSGLRIHPDGRIEALGGAVARLSWRNGGIVAGRPLRPS